MIPMIFRCIRLLFFTREHFPTHRVDVEVLFGRELAGRGHAIDFVMQAGATDTPSGAHEWHGRTVYVGPRSGGDSLFGRALTQCLGLWHDLSSLRLARPERYDAIQVRDKFLIAAVAAVVARVRGLKFFFWLSFPWPEADLDHARSGNARFASVNYLRSALSGWLLYRWVIPRSDHVFVQSERMKEELCARGVDRDHMTAVPMGVDMSEIAAAIGYGSAPATSKTKLGYLGVLDENRKLGVLIEMLALLRRSGLAVSLLLVGDAHTRRDRELLERQASDLGVSDCIEITGMLPRGEALRRIAAVDICLSPIYPSPIFRVASPTKLVEYLALGLPVVANTHPDQRAILLESRAGVCVPWGARYFARAVQWLVRQDSLRLKLMGERGRLWVEEHRTYLQIANEVERKYLMLIPDRSRG